MSTRVNDLWVADFEYCENNNISDEIAKLRRPMKYLKLNIDGSIFDLKIKCVQSNEILLEPVANIELDIKQVKFGDDLNDDF